MAEPLFVAKNRGKWYDRKRKKVQRRCFVIIDIHSHILPGIDDGAKNMQETIDMIHMAVEEGIDAVIATPHYEVGAGFEAMERYQEVYEEVLQYITDHQIPLQLYQGNEIYYSGSIPELLQQGRIRTMNESRYILVEFAPGTEYTSMKRAFSMLLYAGYWPILAHAERYMTLRKLNRVEEIVRMGVCIQLNTSAITGRDGLQIKRYCHKLLKNGLVHVIGTDAHGSRHRRPEMKECVIYLDKKIGITYRRQLCEMNPTRILKGEKIG